MNAERAAPADAGDGGGHALRPGAAVEATDGRLGTLEEAVVRPETGELVYLVVRRGWTDHRLHVAADQIDRVEAGSGGAVHLRATREETVRLGAGVPQTAAGGAALGHLTGDRLSVPILAERLTAETRPVDLGELRVHKRVETEEVRITQDVTRDDLDIERVPIDRPLDSPAATRTEGDWLIVPVMEEVLIVEKRLVLKEEVRIRRRPVTETQEVRETIRKERVELEDATRHGIGGRGAAGTAAAPEGASETPAAAPRPRRESPPAKRRTRRGQGRQRDQKPSTS